MIPQYVQWAILTLLFVALWKIQLVLKVLTYRLHAFLRVIIDFSLTVKAATLIFRSKRGSAISSAKQGKSGSK